MLSNVCVCVCVCNSQSVMTRASEFMLIIQWIVTCNIILCARSSFMYQQFVCNAEVVGAVISVLIIWVLTGVLFYEAIKRIIHQEFEVNANIMLVTACIGVFVNVL